MKVIEGKKKKKKKSKQQKSRGSSQVALGLSNQANLLPVMRKVDVDDPDVKAQRCVDALDLVFP